nr:transmembrane protein 136 [Ipomoea batatas]
MANVVSDHNEVSVKPVFRFLQPNHFHHPCILSSNVGFSVCSRLDLPLLPAGFQSFPSAELVGALWISEISGPFEDLRVILKELGYRDTNLNLAVDICFAVIFSFARMIGGTYLTYLTVSADNPILIKMEDYAIKTVALSSVSWATLFVVTTKVLPKRSFDFRSRIVATFHAFLAITLASLSVQDWSCPLCPLATKPSPQQVFAAPFLCSQTLRLLVFKRLVLPAAALLATKPSPQQCGSEMVGALWVSEISGPFLHLRELLKELGYRDTALNLAVDICFAVIFSLSRMIGGTYLTYLTVSNENPILIKAMSVGLLSVSAFWFYKIARMVIYKLSKKRKAKSFSSKSLSFFRYSAVTLQRRTASSPSLIAGIGELIGIQKVQESENRRKYKNGVFTRLKALYNDDLEAWKSWSLLQESKVWKVLFADSMD